MTTSLQKGDRVTTPFGAGTVAGHEQFDERGMSLPLNDHVTGNRIAVELDPGHTWKVKDQLCYVWKKEILPLGETK